jgi:uncharacterized small protein (TIGR04563 family)
MHKLRPAGAGEVLLLKGTRTMPGSDKRKQSLYFPEEMLKEIQEEAARQDRSLSWIVQKAWKIARSEIKKYPSVNEFPGEEDAREKSS